MGRRVMKEIQTVRVETDNPLLKKLESISQHQINVALGKEEPTEEEKRALVAQQKRAIERAIERAKDFESNRLLKRGKWMEEIAAATRVSPIDVSKEVGDYWGFPLLSDEELEQAARDANNIYQEIETELNFDSKLSRGQIEILLPVMNEFVFAEALSVDDVQMLLDCSSVNPVSVKNVAITAYLMYILQVENWICQNWQSVADEKKVFMSNKGTIIKKSHFSKAMNTKAKSMNYPVDDKGTYILNQEIYDAVMRLKR